MAYLKASADDVVPVWWTAFWQLLPKGSLAVLTWVLCSLPTLALEMRIAIQEGANQVVVGTSNTGTIRNQQGQHIAQVPQGRSLTVAAQGGQVKAANSVSSSFWVEPSANGYVFIGDRWYRGRVLVMSSGSGVTAIN